MRNTEDLNFLRETFISKREKDGLEEMVYSTHANPNIFVKGITRDEDEAIQFLRTISFQLERTLQLHSKERLKEERFPGGFKEKIGRSGSSDPSEGDSLREARTRETRAKYRFP